MTNQKGNKVSGDLAGGSIIKNYYLKSDIKLELTKELMIISNLVNEKLDDGLFVPYENRVVKYCSKLLLISLIEISIPLEVAIDIVKEVPNKIDGEITRNKKLNQNNRFSTKNIQSIVYNILKRLDYSKYGEEQIEIWGENYVRKYGRADVELRVLIDAEQRFELLDRKFIEKEILPPLYEKCYNSDLEEDILLIKSKSVLSTISSEILEKIRLLNLYQIRYGTLFDLAYDMAIQPPHHWFTDKKFRNKHLIYNLKAVKKHYSDFMNDIDIEYSSKEFIEHSSAIILSFYSLFIGVGKLRPLISLLNYLKLKESHKIYWETSELSNFKADINATNVATNFNNFKMLLDKIKYKLQDVQNNNKFLKEKFEIVFNVVNGLVNIQNEVDNFTIKTSSVDELKTKTHFLFRFFDNIILKNNNKLIQEFNNNLFYNKLYSDVKILFLYENEKGVRDLLIPNKLNNSNSILVISNQKLSINTIKKVLQKNDLIDEYIFYLTISELYKIVKNKNRCSFLEHSFYESTI